MPEMTAAVVRRYGPPEVVQLERVPRPVARQGEVVIRVRATTVASADHRLRAMDLPTGFRTLGRLIFGLTGPRQPVLGTELSGEIAEVGPGVDGWVAGQEVVAFPGAKGGAHAEFARMPVAGALVAKPAALGHDAAAALCFGGSTALYFLRDRAGLRAGESLLVTGAGGAVGSAAVQIARAMGAAVTAVCAPDKAETIRDLGAADLLASGQPLPAGRRWDVILDCAGTIDIASARRALAPGGRLCQVLADLPQMLAGAVARLGDGRRVLGGTAPERAKDLADLVKLAEDGAFRPVIGARFGFDDIAGAHALAASGHKLGNTVVLLP